MLYQMLRLILIPILKGYNKLTVQLLKEIPKEGSFILVANHVSYLDPIYIAAVLPRKLRFMAKKESFSYPVIRWLLPHLGAFPVDRSKADIKAIKKAISIIKNGEVLAIFPQGTRGSDKLEIDDIKKGAAYFAIKTNAPIIPAYITGTDEVMPKGHRMIKPKKVTVYFGNPIYPNDALNQEKENKLEELTQDVLHSINSLSDYHKRKESSD